MRTLPEDCKKKRGRINTRGFGEINEDISLCAEEKGALVKEENKVNVDGA